MSPRASNPQQKVLEFQDLDRAVWIDFEGNQLLPPTLVGVLDHLGVYRVSVLEASFAQAADYPVRFGSVSASDMEVFARELCSLAEESDLTVVSWSRREIIAFQEAGLPSGVLSKLEARYRNGLPTAKRWLKRVHGEDLPDPTSPYEAKHSLIRFMELMDFDVPRAFGPGHTGDRLRKVRGMLETRGGEFSALTAVKKGQWTKTVGHNWFDCHGLRHVVRRAAFELAHGSGSYGETPPSPPP